MGKKRGKKKKKKKKKKKEEKKESHPTKKGGAVWWLKGQRYYSDIQRPSSQKCARTCVLHPKRFGVPPP